SSGGRGGAHIGWVSPAAGAPGPSVVSGENSRPHSSQWTGRPSSASETANSARQSGFGHWTWTDIDQPSGTSPPGKNGAILAERVRGEERYPRSTPPVWAGPLGLA